MRSARQGGNVGERSSRSGTSRFRPTRFRVLCFSGRTLTFSVILSHWLVPASLHAEEGGLRVEGGERHVTPPVVGTEGTSSEARQGPPPTHRRGPRPKTPEPTLPEDVPLGEPSSRARHAIAEGPLSEELAKGAPDEQLALLRAADKVLFPELLRGISPSWSFDLPGDEVDGYDGLGLPLTGREGAVSEPADRDVAWLRSLTLPDLPVRLDRRVVTYLKFYRDSPRGRTIAAIFARKRGRYTASMKAAFRRAGLPTDLVWLSMIESGHEPTITSPAGAAGLWQFMPESGRMYGLTVDRWVDERRDPARSTQAAIHFLSDLYQRFGNWELAMGAYNMGYAGMSRAIAKFNTNDYWTLSRLESGIPWETTLYVPKIFALAVVMNNPREFGLAGIKPDPAVSFDSILVSPGVSLSQVAKAAGVSAEEIGALNPKYVAGRIPPSAPSTAPTKLRVSVPKGLGEKAAAQLARTGGDVPKTVVVKLGDRIDTLAAALGVSETVLQRENGIAEEQLEPGTVLVLPKGARPTPQPSGRDAIVVSRQLGAGSGQKIALYDVAPGDDLSEIAAAFGVTETELARDNALDKRARLRSGMTLQVIVPEGRDLDHIRHQILTEDLRDLVLVSGSPEFHTYFEGLKGKKRHIVTVRKGDTLSGLGQRYGMSVGSMERVNRRSRKSPLLPGEQLVVYTDRGRGNITDGLTPQPLGPVHAPRPELLPSARTSAKADAGDER